MGEVPLYGVGVFCSPARRTIIMKQLCLCHVQQYEELLGDFTLLGPVSRLNTFIRNTYNLDIHTDFLAPGPGWVGA